MGAVIQKSSTERELLKKLVSRAEKLSQFFDDKVPYEELLGGYRRQKYTDARHLLSKGLTPSQVSSEVGLEESEVKLIAAIR